MLTTTSSFNSVTMAQIETLFAALPARHGKLVHKPEVKPSARQDAAQASPARNVAGENFAGNTGADISSERRPVPIAGVTRRRLQQPLRDAWL